MKQKVLLGLFVSLPFVCTIPVFATGNIPATEKRDIQISRYDEERNRMEPLVGYVSQNLKKVKGKISDTGGDPLPGATVQIKGSTKGVIADVDGNFEFDGVNTNAVLVVSFIGMETKELTYKGEGFLNIVMEPKADELEEVTVVAFAKQKKESVVSAITTVKPAELKIPSSNLTTAFAGRVAGLISYQTSGEPGQDNANFFIRGITTFGADAKKDPLILIDGIELSTDDLARLNTDDIASFTIMKDATATALYGARGANGVISVTTKEGREGKVAVNVRIENSFSTPTSRVDQADPVTYMRMQNEAIKTRDPLGLALYSQEKITMTERGLYPDIFPSTDWYSTMFKDLTMNQRANISVSGGGTVARYYVAANMTRDNGNVKVDKRNNFNSNINLMKYTIRSNVNVNLTKTTELVLRMSAAFDDYSGPIGGGSGMYNHVMQANPVLFKPYYEPDEQYSYANHILFGNYGDANYINPYAQSLRGYNEYSKNTMLTQFVVNQDLDMITEGLTASVLVNMDRYSEYTVDRAYTPFYYSISSFDMQDQSYKLSRLNPTTGTEWINYQPGQRKINSSVYLEAKAEYTRLFNDKHTVNALFVYTMRNQKSGIADNLQLSLPYRNIGLAGRMAYNFDSRYFGEFTFGYNGSERFSKNNRWGFFPSIAVGYNISEEAFFEPLKNVFSNMKIRASWGLVGNDNIGGARFVYMPTINLTGTGYTTGLDGDITYKGPVYSRYGNPEVTWEVGKKVNVGLDLQLFNSLNLTMDYFHETRTDIFQERGTIPQYLGTAGTKVFGNLAAMKNQGFDFAADFNKKIGKDWFISFKGTFTYAHNEITKYDESPKYAFQSKVGQSANIPSIMISDGLFKDPDDVKNSNQQIGGNLSAGDIKYVNISKLYGYDDDIVDISDWVWAKNPTVPEIVYGFGPSIRWKNLDFSFFFQGVAKVSLVMSDFHPFGDNSLRNVLTWIADDRWSPDNQNINATYPRLTRDTSVNNTQRSDYWLRNAAFIKLKNAEIGYTYKNMRFYVSGMNLATFSPFKHWDPEQGGGNGLKYPTQRVFNFGFQMTINNNR